MERMPVMDEVQYFGIRSIILGLQTISRTHRFGIRSIISGTLAVQEGVGNLYSNRARSVAQRVSCESTQSLALEVSATS